MEGRADAVVARRTDPVRPLRIAWTHRVRPYRANATHLGGEGALRAWRGHVVVPAYAGPGGLDLGAILDRDGHVLHTLAAPPPHTRSRTFACPVVTWPDEGLVGGVHAERFQLLWIDLDGGSQLADTDLAERALATDQPFELTATSDGAVLVSTATAHANHDDLDWPLDPRLDAIYANVRRAPFEHHESATACVDRGGRTRWEAPGRVGCVADDVALLTEGSGRARAIVARRIADGGELWRREAVDAFVLGAIPMPAWSDDRIYVLDRGARRRQSWAREAELVRIHRIAPDAPMRTLLSIRAAARERDELYPITAPSIVSCLSTRTGAGLWHANVDGDVVSFACTPAWVACTIAGARGAIRVWRHDGTAVADARIEPFEPSESSWWPPDAGRWPCLAAGDATHVVVAQNRSKRQGGSRLYEAAIEAPDAPRWELALPAPCVGMPLFRWLRLLNRVPMAFAADAAFLRWGKRVYGLVP